MKKYSKQMNMNDQNYHKIHELALQHKCDVT